MFQQIIKTMDILNILGEIWMFLYPLLIISTFIVVLAKIFGYRRANLYSFNIFSGLFVFLTLAAFGYYLVNVLAGSDKSFFELIKGFYDWNIYIAFYFLIISLIGTFIYIKIR